MQTLISIVDRPATRGLRSRGVVGLLLLLAVAAVAFVPSASVEADEITLVGEQSFDSDDPTSVTFGARIQAPAGLDQATLIYRVLNPKDGDVGGTGAASFSPGAETDVSFTLETRTAQRYIPVGSIFAYHWELTDREGDTFATPEEQAIFLDGRYNWESRTEGDVSVYWYGGNDDIADAAFAATSGALAQTQELLQVTVPYPIRVLVWASEDDGTLARRQQSAGFDAQVRTGGQRVAPDVVFVFVFTTDVVRHEVAHIVTAVAGDGPFSDVPSWLDEGTAVYMQNNPGNYGFAIDFAVQTDQTTRLRYMQASENDPSRIDIFYGQSYSTVDFLISEFGEERFAELYRTVVAGSTMDGALDAVYGLDQDGIYNAWREANDLDPIEFESSADVAVPEGTRAPLGIPTSGVGSSGSSDGGGDSSGGSGDSGEAPATGTPGDGAAGSLDDGGSSNTTTIIVGVAVLLVGALLGLAAFRLYRGGGKPAG